MAMVVKNNMTAINTLNTLNKNSSALSKSLQKVSSGMKINSAADDASGYAISERMRVQIRSLDQANQNTQNGSSMMKVAEGAVSSTVEILKTLKEKAVNAANDSNTDSDRLTIQKELDQSIDQINDNANVTFNGKYLVDGSKNSKGEATYTALTNQSLAEDTKATTKLTDLAARNGDSLEIHDTDKITVSYVQGGKTYSTTFQVGDKTLQDIFAEAEDMDKSSQIFATNSNEAIQKVGGASATSDADAVEKAIELLKTQLSNGDTAGTLGTSADIESSAAGAGATAGEYHGAGTGASITADKAGTKALKSYVYTTDGAAVGTDNVMAAGSLYTAVIDADQALTDAVNALGKKEDSNSLAGKLQRELEKAGVTDWDGEANSLNESKIAEYAKNAANADKLKEAYANYVAGVEAKDTAESNMATAVGNYTKAQDQLEALILQKNVTDAEATVAAATSEVKAKEDATAAAKANLVASVSAALEKASTDLTDSTKVSTLGYKNGASVTAGAEAITGGTTEVLTDFENNATNREKVINALSNDLKQLDVVSANAETKGSVDGTKEKDAANVLLGLVNESETDAAAAASTAKLTETQEMTDALDKIESTYKDLHSATGKLKDANAGLVEAKAKAAALSTANGTNMKDALKSAYDEVLAQFSGPVVLTGSAVGVNGAGNTVETASGKNAITITANTAGISGQISGLNISVSDSEGNVKKSANAALDAFEETIRAQNKSDDNAISLQVGAKANQSIKVGLTDMRAEALGLQGADGTKLNISTQNKANAAINVLDNALQKALDQQTTIGSVESRLEYTSSNLTTASENVQASESTIRDADMAKEMTNYTKNNVLLQAAQSMLAQANQSSSNVLSLLQ